MDDVIFFETPDEFRSWLAEHHTTATELWVGFHRKHTGKGGITWAEAVDQALCFGWIDSVRKRVDENRYTNRFTPRKSRSTWSATNCQRVEELIALGLMRSAGLAVYEARDQAKTRQYSYEAAARELSDDDQHHFRANATAWTFFQSQPLSYRKAASWWVISAKKDETRAKRIATLIDDSQLGQRVAHLRRDTTGKPDS